EPASRDRGRRDIRARLYRGARVVARVLFRDIAMRIRVLATMALLALAVPQVAFARGHFDPTTEFEQHEWVPIHLGPLNLSITKAVAYLMIGTVVTIALGLFTMRSRLALLPDKRQTVGEAIYEVAQTQVAEQGLPSKAIGRWFPYVATIMLFIWVVNML